MTAKGGIQEMKIAVLGWGSLRWDRRNLCIDGEWHDDGPELPIEFARISTDGRLTLVLCKGAENVQTLWACSGLKNLEDAISNLQKREGDTKEEHIGYFEVDSGKCRCNVIPEIADSIKDWAKGKNLDAVIWTDLPTNFELPFTEKNVIAYLRCLKDQGNEKNAEEYIRKAPCQIRTRMRQVIEKKLGWTPVSTCN